MSSFCMLKHLHHEIAGLSGSMCSRQHAQGLLLPSKRSINLYWLPVMGLPGPACRTIVCWLSVQRCMEHMRSQRWRAAHTAC